MVNQGKEVIFWTGWRRRREARRTRNTGNSRIKIDILAREQLSKGLA